MLDIKIRNRIDWFCKNQINDFAPTISPAPKNMEYREIESIREAIHYFMENEVFHLVVQKKYMGSYCSIYLKRDLEKTYFISRNGYRIDHVNREQAIDAVRQLHNRMLVKYPDFDTIIIASELMPWSALGSKLIEKDYLAYYDAFYTHNDYLSQANLYTKIEEVKSAEAYKGYLIDKEILSNSALKEKYKSHILRQYDALTDLVIIDLEKQRNSLNIFKDQIDLFGKEDTLSFKPFNILKIVFQNGSEHIPNNNLSYGDINDDEYLDIYLTKENYNVSLERIYQFFEQLTSENEEGIMIKPGKSYIKGIVPCFKVRNNHYLTMIYGVNFSMDYPYYLTKRNIKRKMEQSIQGWEINQQMLQIPYNEIDFENYYLKLLMLKRIQGEDVEKTLDTRL